MATITPTRFLTIDIGGSGLKAAVVDRAGAQLTERVRVKTPRPCRPDALLERLVSLVTPLAPYDRVTVGFPGVVRGGVIVTAPNLGSARLAGFDLGAAVEARLHRPTRVANDATVQGLAAIGGRGVELVLTLGTGLGAALFLEGRPLPTFELGHHAFYRRRTYEECLGNRALDKHGRKKWNHHLKRAIRAIRALLVFDHLYLGGGNARHIRLTLADDTSTISNDNGVKGGVALWIGPAADAFEASRQR